MRQKLDNTFQEIIIKTINAQYNINDNNQIFDIETEETLYPIELSQYIETVFDIEKEYADHTTFNWLFENGFKDIQENWKGLFLFNGYLDSTTFGGNEYDNNIVLGGPESQLRIPYDSFTLTGTSNTIVIGNDNVVTTSNTAVIGNDNVVTTTAGDGMIYSGASLTNYFVSCDVATDNCITIQMHPDGTHEYINR